MRPGETIGRRSSPRGTLGRGYQLIEALVYLSLLFALIGVGYAALYRCTDFSVLLRRNADDITRTVKAGEVWRADVRAAHGSLSSETLAGQEVLHLKQPDTEIYYAFHDGTVFRRAGTGPWINVLSQVKASVMQADQQYNVKAWRWELQLQPQAKGNIKPSRIRPLFTFLAVSQPNSAP